MCAVAKGFLGRRAATAERHPFFDRELIAVAVFQFYFARHDVRAVLDCLDCHHVRTLSEVDRVVPTRCWFHASEGRHTFWHRPACCGRSRSTWISPALE